MTCSSILSSAFDAPTPQRPPTYSLTAETPPAGLSTISQQQQQQPATHPLSAPDEAVSSAGDLDVGDFGVVSGSEAHSTVSTAPEVRGTAHEHLQSGSSAVALNPARNAADHVQDQHSQRPTTLKGAFRSVVAWGSGLGQRLQRVAVPGLHAQQQQPKRQGELAGSLKTAVSSSRGRKGVVSSQEMANF